MAYTSEQLIADARRFATLPSFDEGAEANLLRLLNTEQWTYLAKQLESTREEYRTTTLDMTVTAGQRSYALPPRAIAAGLKMLQVVASDGTVWGMWELRPEDFPQGGPWVSPCQRFYLQGNTVRLYADPPAGTLRVTYPLRLSELVLASDSANTRAITVINTSTKTVALAGTFTNAAGLCDIVKGTPHFDILSMEASFTGSGTSTLVFANTLPTGLAVGDYICTPGKSPVCQAPLELHSLLAQHVAYVVLQAKADPRAMALRDLRDNTARDVLALLQPRPQRSRSVVNYAAPGFGRWGVNGVYRGGS